MLSAGGSNDLAFKLRRKRFAIETFHLPPEGGVVTRRTEPPPDEPTKTNSSSTPSANKGSFQKRHTGGSGSVGCGSRPGKVDPLEF